jgi:hypothetical protein
MMIQDHGMAGVGSPVCVVGVTIFGDQQALEILIEQLRLAQRSGRFRITRESVCLRRQSETLVELLAEIPTDLPGATL